MKKAFEVPEVEVVNFVIADIITTSGDDNNWGGGGVGM